MNPRNTLGIGMVVLLLALASAPASAARDSDGDGMPNRWERRHGLDPHRANAEADPDRDGLSNLQEYRLHSDPQDPDSDGNGIPDGNEDVDGDGVADEDADDSATGMTRAERREDLDDLTEPGVHGRATSSPTCPAERPGDPDCRPRQLEGANIVVRDSNGDEIGRVVTGVDGWYTFELDPGRYTLEGEPFESSLPRPPEPVDFRIAPGDTGPHRIDLDYDSGIR